MFQSITHTKRGFTLIELLVVIAIIGILSSVVLASLSTAREKSRDAKRISDLGQVKLALELYFDTNQTYPEQAAANGITAGLAPTYIPQIPLTPPGTAAYQYLGLNTATDPDTACAGTFASPCAAYALFSQLERFDNSALQNDRDVVTTTVVLNGTSVACTNTAAAPQVAGAVVQAGERCYDTAP
jgi:prepilin-type N-terminal cleavage/methylation domain-containing protein